jgi:sulfane dehydrogenase subunit SoxC
MGFNVKTSDKKGETAPTGAKSSHLISRRSALLGLAGAAGVVLVQTAGGRVVQAAPASYPPVPADPTKVMGAPPSERSDRSPFEQPRRVVWRASSQTPLQDLHGIITPADLHYERHHGGIPLIDPERYELLIHGMVDRPMRFSLAELKRFPAVSRICFLECSGNLWRAATEEAKPQDICGLTSQSEWTGVMLSTLFREVGVKPKASWFLAEGSDAAVMTRSIPLEKGWKDAMIAYAQNGEAVRPANGYPARLLVPGWEGNMSIKWIRRIELSDQPFMSREETSKYTEPLKGGKARMFSFVMDARSIITFPAYPNVLEKGWVEIRGLAWSGRGRISRVDISTDGGKNWQPALLQEPVMSLAHVRFSFLWKWNGQETEIMSRAVDETGYVQPTRSQLIAARGKGAVPYHLNPITAWRIKRNGEVVFREEAWS